MVFTGALSTRATYIRDQFTKLDLSVLRRGLEMRRVLAIIMILQTTALFCQSPSPQYQSALILQVKEHQGVVAGQVNDPTVTSYDVTLRVKDTGTEYVVLYTPRPGVPL